MRNITLLGSRQKPNRHDRRHIGAIQNRKNWNIFNLIHQEVDSEINQARIMREKLETI